MRLGCGMQPRAGRWLGGAASAGVGVDSRFALPRGSIATELARVPGYFDM
jgi:hypothetical protein